MSDHHPNMHSESIMEVETYIGLIERIGLPAVIIAACMWYIWKSQLAHREEIKEWNHKDSKSDERLIDLRWLHLLSITFPLPTKTLPRPTRDWLWRLREWQKQL